MTPAIMTIVGDLWYSGRLRSGTTSAPVNCRHGVLGDERIAVVDTSGCPVYRSRRHDHGYHAEVAAALARSLVGVPGNVAVITRHVDQVRAISAQLGRAKQTLPIRVDTVHSYQGGEADTVIIDVPASRQHWGGDWISARIPRSDGDRVLAVAASRARERLILIGDSPFLTSGSLKGTVLSTLVERMERDGVTIRGDVLLRSLAARAA